MKTIIAGSRTITTYAQVLSACNVADRAPHNIHITEVVSGCARGVDKMGEEFAAAHSIPIRYFPAAWNTFGKSAGYLRNQRMARYAEALIAVWDGESRGTKHMIDLAKRHGLKVYVYITPATPLKAPRKVTGV